MLQPLNKDILFIFTDKVKNGTFKESTDWGLEMVENHDRTAKQGRWGKVVAVGPNVDREEVPPSGWIFIEPLMWSRGATIDGIKIWKTDASKVMLISDEMPK